MKKNFTILIIFICFGLINAQDENVRMENLKAQFDLMINTAPGLENLVDVSVSGVPLSEFLRALGTNNKVNISVNPSVHGNVINTFSNATVMDVLLFIAKQHNVDYDITGNIIYAKPYVYTPPPKINIPHLPDIYYDTITNKITLELKSDTLSKVAKALTRETGYNVVFQPEISSKTISIYLEEVEFDQAMDKIAFTSNLQISKTEDGFYLIEDTPQQPSGKGPSGPSGSQKRFQDLNQIRNVGRVAIDSVFIDLEIENQPLDLVVRNLFERLKLDYFIYENLQGNVTLKVQHQKLEPLLSKLFDGTPYTFRERDSIYILGNRTAEGLRESKRIKIMNRSVEQILQYIPADLKAGIEVVEFQELNSLVVSGSYPNILKLEDFLTSIDQPVPVVIIEVMIVDYQRNNIVSSGIEAGISEEPVKSGGQLYPALDYTLSAESINKILASFEGFGALNLGSVAPNFYLTVKLLEDNGILNVKSTPKLSTLNGHEASISIGNTEYYVVEQTNITGVQNPIPITTRNYQQVQANFTLNIKPFVSANSHVTLQIDVEQSDFTSRISPEAPPGTVTRQFNSLIRVKDGDMILLGGLEEKGFNDTGRGVPILSRIPILRWLFSSRTRNYNKSKLNIFIKPTIIN